jgi:hypothetical protein
MLGAFDTTDQAVATAVLNPGQASSGTDLPAGDSLILDSEEGGGAFASITGTQTVTAMLNGSLNLSGFATGADLMLDLPASTLVGGSGVTAVQLVVEIGTARVVENFTSGAAAQAYFTKNVIDLGSIGSLTNQPTNANFEINLSVSVDAAGAGFYVDPIFGAPAPACFCTGTRIAAPGAQRAVEDLRAGDTVLTVSGAARSVIWVGARSIDILRHPHPERVRPIRIRAHAFADNVPVRDLLVSPDHCLFLHGALIPARCLVDAASVTVETVDRVTYHHVELASHDVVFAEGLPAESYLDTGNRQCFAGPVMALHPGFGSIPDDRCVAGGDRAYARLAVTGPEIDAALATLAARRSGAGPARRPALARM